MRANTALSLANLVRIVNKCYGPSMHNLYMGMQYTVVRLQAIYQCMLTPTNQLSVTKKIIKLKLKHSAFEFFNIPTVSNIQS